MTALLPVPRPNESTEAFLQRLMAALRGGAGAGGNDGSATTGVAYLVDNLNRPIVTPEGLYGYSDPDQTAATAPIAPNRVRIDTTELVDGAVTLTQTNIPTLVLGNKAVFGDAVVISLLAGNVEAVTAEIDNLSVNDANIVSLTAAKISAGTIAAGGIYVGSNRFELDGVNQRLRVLDLNGFVRVTLGKLGSGSANYGLEVRDGAGGLMFSSGSSTSIDGAYINSLAANKISAGTLAASVILASNIAASQIVAGTMTGFVIQTTNGISQATTRLSGTNNRLESYDASGNLVAAVGAATGVGGQVYAFSPSFIQAAGRFESTGGTAVSAVSTTIDLGLPAVAGIGVGIGVSGSSSANHGVVGEASAGSGNGVKATSVNASGVLGQSTNSNGGDFKNIAGSGGWGSIGVPIGFGGWAFYSQVGTYGPFTGAHDALIRKDAESDVGDLVIDAQIAARFGWSDAIAEVAVSSSDAQPNASGMIIWRGELADRTAAMRGLSDAEFETLQATYDLVVMNALGEGLMNVCGAGGEIAKGDLLVTSGRPGIGTKQGDDVVRSSTVAKAREAVTFDTPSEIKQIAVKYLCG